jgi:hypothetical protein
MAGRTMVERVARALARADNGVPTTWRLYVDDAMVAIGAMREPTAAVLEAGQCTSEQWARMIEAALAGT